MFRQRWGRGLGAVGGSHHIARPFAWATGPASSAGARSSLARAVIESLDDDGYLRGGVEEIEQAVHTMALSPKPDEQEIRMAWRRVQGLDPAGVAAVDLQHCLLLQLHTLECGTSRDLVRRAIESHLKAVALRDPARLSEALGCRARRRQRFARRFARSIPVLAEPSCKTMCRLRCLTSLR